MSGCHEEILTQGGLLKQRIRQAGVCVCVYSGTISRELYVFFMSRLALFVIAR